MDNPVLTAEIHHLTIGYGNVILLDDVSFLIRPGEVVGIWGKNGSGKSTLLKAFLGEAISKGEVNIIGGRKHFDSLCFISPTLSISFLPQGRRTIAQLTVRENLHLALWKYSGRSLREAAISRLCDRPVFAELKDWLDIDVSYLSGGQDLLVGLAVIELLDANIVLLDEPSDGLDLVNRDLIIEFVGNLREKGKAVILVEQVLKVLFLVSDRVYVIKPLNHSDIKTEMISTNTLVELSGDDIYSIKNSFSNNKVISSDDKLNILEVMTRY